MSEKTEIIPFPLGRRSGVMHPRGVDGGTAPPWGEQWNDDVKTAKELALCSTEEARRLITYNDALRWGVLPLGLVKCRGQDLLTLAGKAPWSLETEQAIRFLTGCEISVVTVSDMELPEAIFLAYRSDVSSVETITTALQESVTPPSLPGTESSSPFSLSSPLITTREPSVPLLVARLLEYAISKGASDLALEPVSETACHCTLRIDGILRRIDLGGYTPHIHEQVVQRTRVLGGVASGAKVQAPEDGAFVLPLPSAQREVRFHIFPTVTGAKLHFRLPNTGSIPSLPSLGFTAKTRTFLESVLERDRGGVLLSGPTGSGKSTTAYSALCHLQGQSRSIVSLEDPVERDIFGISQTDLSRLSAVSYADGIRHLLRQDPDIIFVGEIRDQLGAIAALEAAASGHLLITSIHSSSTLDALERLARLSDDRDLVADVMQLVICQRLVPRLCKKCRVIDLPSSDMVHGQVYQAVGCPLCEHSGYAGRTLIEESLYITTDLKQRFVADEIFRSEMPGKRFFQSLEDSAREALLSGAVDVKQMRKIILPLI